MRLTLSLAALTLAAAPTIASADGLNAYRVKATPAHLKTLAAAGFDVTEGRNFKRGTIDVVGTAAQVGPSKLDARRLSNYREPAAAPKTAQGKGAKAARRVDPAAGADDSAFTVWTKYDAVDEPGDEDEKEQYTEQYDRLEADFPGIVKRRVIGTTANGRDIIALQVTKGATGADIPGRPAVLYTAMQHAREWLAGETCRRTLDLVTSDYGKTTSSGKEITPLVDNTELWFVCVANPDGYEFTFTPGHRLWRKNLRDNDNNGVITTADGVDPNRNYPSNWGRDDEGSSPQPQSETYRGPSAASEPETQAMEALFDEIHPVFHKNDHTAAQLLLYPQGFQQDTPTPDNPIFTALAGDPFKPGIEGFLPELSAGLYITNGDFTDYAYNMANSLSFTPEGTAAEDPDVSGFEYPDSPLQIDQEYRRHLQFALDLAKSAPHPDEPTSHLGNNAADFEVDSFKFSYGDPQAVGAVVKRSLGQVSMKFRIDGGPTQVVPTTDYLGGERYNKDKGVYYKRVRGFVVGTEPGQHVEVWFSAGGEESRHFTYEAVVESTNPVLLLANEDWSGKQPNPAPLAGPQHLAEYKAALDAAGVKYDEYDVDARGRTAPNALGVLSHYSHVVWFSGEDYVTRAPDAPGGSGMDRLAVDTQNEVRDFLNDGGKLFYSGEHAGQEFAENYTYNPFQVEEGTYCQDENPTCIASQDDFLQYWLGAYRYVVGGGEDGNATPFPVHGTGPFAGTDLTLQAPGDGTPTLLTTSSVLDPATYPLFASSAAAGAWQRPFASPFSPHDGGWFLSAGADDQAYKRLLKPFSIPVGGGTVKFATSFDLETDYDYMFVEIHTVGNDDWTTLADANGHTSDDVGQSCLTTGDGSAWQTNHPFLAHYQTVTGTGDACTPTGTSGAWNAATGNSGGWQNWELPIPAAYVGQDVEISVTVATDPASLGLGTWVDELSVVDDTNAPINTTDPSFEAGMDGWTLPGPPLPAGSGGQSDATGWVRAQTAPFVEAPIVTTDDTVYTAFGLESVTDADDRTALVSQAMEHLGAPSKPHPNAPAPTPETPAGGGGGTGGGGGGTGGGGGGTGGGGGGTGGGTGAGGGGAGGGGIVPTPPGANPAPQPKRLSGLTLGSSRSLAVLLTRGLALAARCTTGCNLSAQLTVDAATQRRLHLRSRTLGSLRFSLKQSGTRRVRVFLTAAARQRLKGVRALRVTVTVTQVGTRPAVKRSATLTLRR